MVLRRHANSTLHFSFRIANFVLEMKRNSLNVVAKVCVCVWGGGGGAGGGARGVLINVFVYLFIYLFCFFPVGRGTLLQVSPITASTLYGR